MEQINKNSIGEGMKIKCKCGWQIMVTEIFGTIKQDNKIEIGFDYEEIN